ncbi:hypothetical protein XPR_2997, partial [Xanthomonas arboricola pv. pruni MAFF 301420]
DPVYVVHGVGVPDRGSGAGDRAADVVPAVRAQGPRLHAQRAGARQGGRGDHTGVHRGHAHAGRALPRCALGHERAQCVAAAHAAGGDASALGLGRGPAGSPARSGQYLDLPRQPDRPAGLHRLAGRQLRPVHRLERPGMDPRVLDRADGDQGHPGPGRCARCGALRRRRHRGVQPWRPPARRRAVQRARIAG